MKHLIKLCELRAIILDCILEADEVNKVNYFDGNNAARIEGEKDAAKEDKYNKTSGSATDWRGHEDKAFLEEIEETMQLPEYQTLEAFITYKFDNDDLEFNAVDLQALARVIDQKKSRIKIAAPSAMTIATIKKSLKDDLGFKFVARQPVKHVRGSMSPGHGTHPFAGSVGGGSGFSAGWDGAVADARFSSGVGTMGGGKPWDSNDKKNLRMSPPVKKR